MANRKKRRQSGNGHPAETPDAASSLAVIADGNRNNRHWAFCIGHYATTTLSFRTVLRPSPFALRSFYCAPAPAVSLRPTIPAMITAMEIKRSISVDSWNMIMPVMATPTAPMPAQTA
jgi:hypothetical protein